MGKGGERTREGKERREKRKERRCIYAMYTLPPNINRRRRLIFRVCMFVNYIGLLEKHERVMMKFYANFGVCRGAGCLLTCSTEEVRHKIVFKIEKLAHWHQLIGLATGAYVSRYLS